MLVVLKRIHLHILQIFREFDLTDFLNRAILGIALLFLS